MTTNSSLSQGARRLLALVSAVPLLSAAVLALPATPASARALYIIGCDESSDSDEAAFIAAINAANDESHHPGEDVIQLTDDCAYTFAAGGSGADTLLPVVTSAIEVWGRNASLSAVTTAFNTGINHMLTVGSTGDLNLQDLAVQPADGSPTFLGQIYVEGTLLLQRTSFLSNDGAAVAGPGTIGVEDSLFKGNNNPNRVGAAIDAGGSLTVSGSTFEANWTVHNPVANNFTLAAGGAIYLAEGGGAFIQSSHFIGNVAYNGGGAIFNEGSMAVTTSTFDLNDSDSGGAIWNHGSSLTVTRSSFLYNHGVSGGAIYSWGQTSIGNSTFFTNDASNHGGAVAGQGPADLSITSSTFASNDSATDQGDAVYQGGAPGTTSMSVFADQPSACYGLTAGEGDITDHFDPTCPGNFQIGDPKLSVPALNGGPTKTMRLGAGSFAAEHITSGCPSADQRGYPRPSGAKCDSGAYEDQAPSTPGTPSVTAGSNPSKTGSLTIGWAASSDADDTVSYRLLRKDADDAAYTEVGTASTATSRVLTEAEGTYSYSVQARDGNHAVPSGTLTGVVVDKSAPAIPTVSADRAPDYAPASGTAWYADTVTVTATSNGDPALADGSAGSGVASVTPAATYATSGTSTFTGTATDAAGNTSSGASLAVHVDAESPTAGFRDCPATVLLKHAATTGWTASDPSSGLATPASGSFTLDTATIGHKSVTTTATDNVGHSTPITCGYDVIYDFAGFYTPLVNPPSVYKASAGQNVPVSFSLAGDQGLGVIAVGYPQSVQVACNAFGSQTTGTATTAIKPGLVYATSSGGRYNYVWKTSTAWRGTCRQLVLKLNDGTYHRANLSFG